MGFSPEELAEMAAADAEIEKGFRLTREEREACRMRDLAAANLLEKAAQRQRYYMAHKAELNAKAKAYRDANKEHVAALRKARYEANREEINARRRAMYAEKKQKKCPEATAVARDTKGK